MKRVLLTGATGFIGRYAISVLLEKGYEVHAVFHAGRPTVTNVPQLFWHQCNLMDTAQQRRVMEEAKPTHLLHLAWYTIPGKFWTSFENLRWLQASIDILMNFTASGGERAVLAGSCAEYDWSYGFYSEEVTPLRPSSLYGACKHSLQQILRFVSQQTGLSSAWGRIFFLYGPYEHQSRLVPTVINSILRGCVAKCTHGRQIRDFLFVEDVASAFVALLESSIEGPINIASGKPVAIRKIVKWIAEYLGQPDSVALGALPAPAAEPRFLVADVSKLKYELSWFPKYSLDKGLEATVTWWQKNNSFKMDKECRL